MSTYFATKYDSAREEIIAVLADSTEGFGTDSIGEVDAPTGFVQTVTLDESCDLDFSDHTNYPAGDYAGEIARTYRVIGSDVLGHHIVQHNDQGFVRVITFSLDDTDSFEEYKSDIAGILEDWYTSNGE
jgi:hypothetical protein